MGKIKMRRGLWEEARFSFEKSLDLGTDSLGGQQVIGIVNVLKYSGQYQDALDKALELRDESRAGEKTDAELLALGEIVALYKILGKSESALESARAGGELARKLEDSGEELLFLTEEAQVLLSLNQFEAALDAAENARTRAVNDAQKFQLSGVLTEANLRLSRFEAAADCAKAGLEQSRALEIPMEQAAFLNDLGRINKALAQKEAALEYFREAGKIYVNGGQRELFIKNGSEILRLGLELQKWTIFFETLANQVILSDEAGVEIQGSVIFALVENLKKLPELEQNTPLRTGLAFTEQTVSDFIKQNETKVSGQVQFALDLLRLFHAWHSDNKPRAQKLALTLDEASGNRLGLKAFTEKTPLDS